MSESTSISDLQPDPVGSNITMTMTEPVQQQQQPSGPTMSPSAPPGATGLDESTIQQLISGIQKASLSGLTQLPSRDIPMTTAAHTTDNQTMPNFVPPPPASHGDYIGAAEQSKEDLVSAYQRAMQTKDTMEEMYSDLQAPLLLGVLYFLFQLPFVRRLLYKYLPILFGEDANYNLYGFLFCSVMFGGMYHVLSKGTKFFNRF